MKPLWKQLLYLHGHVLPTDLRWRKDAPEAGGRPLATRSFAPMLRWREVLRAALIR